MTTLGEFVKTYVPSATVTKNIADLPKVSTKSVILTKDAKKKDGTPFKYYYVEVEGQEYRVPKTVIDQLQTILKFAPQLEYFKVSKTGTTKDDTKYKVEPFVWVKDKQSLWTQRRYKKHLTHCVTELLSLKLRWLNIKRLLMSSVNFLCLVSSPNLDASINTKNKLPSSDWFPLYSSPARAFILTQYIPRKRVAVAWFLTSSDVGFESQTGFE